MDTRYLYIVLTRSNTVISKLIQIFTNDKYTHASISLDENLAQMYSFGRKYTHNPFIGGFKKEDLDRGIYRVFQTVPSVVIEIQVSKKQYDKANKMLGRFISSSNLYKYNYIGLLQNLFNKSACYDYRFYCSEFVYHILNESGIVDFQKSRNLVKPEDLLNIEGKIIYEGNLKCINLSHGICDIGTTDDDLLLLDNLYLSTPIDKL